MAAAMKSFLDIRSNVNAPARIGELIGHERGFTVETMHHCTTHPCRG
jgi:hypothetical protein